MNKPYIPAIDGMRAMAIGIVIVSHFGAERFVPGGFGVTLFFFISGYLITRLLVHEASVAGKIEIPSFYIRRFLRLGPALIIMILIVSFVYRLLVGPVSGFQILSGLLYYTNYYGLFGGKAPLPIWPLWSLAVEEHYYLIYPLALVIAWKWRERFLGGLIVLTLAVLLWRSVLVLLWHVPEDRTYTATDTRIDSILYGAILAVMLEIGSKKIVRLLEHWAAIAAAVCLLLLTFIYRDPTFRETLRYSLQGLSLLPLFYVAVFAPGFSVVRMVLEAPVIVWVGKLSYSLYLYHFPVLFFVPMLLPKTTALSLLSINLSATITAASLSYYCIEKPFRGLRDRFRGDRTRPC